MACISRIPQCGDRTTSSVMPTPLSSIGSVIGIGVTVVGGVSGAIGVADKLPSFIGALGGASAGGAVSGALGGITVIILIGVYALDRCASGGTGLQECIAGVVNNIVESFSDGWQNVLPFTAMHDRADIVVKSRYWDILESSGAFVQCTDDPTPRRSEIMRCYFFSREVCNAETGAQYGAAVGAVAGLIVAAIAAAAIGCATVFLCILGLVVAFIIGAVAALLGALAGGQIGRAASTNDHPSAGGSTLTTGDLVSVNGTRSRRAEDNGAWVMWWVTLADSHGHVRSTVPANPFSYCEIDDELPMDSCPLPPMH